MRLRIKINKKSLTKISLVLFSVILLGIVMLLPHKTVSAITEPFTIKEHTIYDLVENVVYIEIKENLGKNQIINISSVFKDDPLTRDIFYKNILVNQSYQADVYGLINVSLGKYSITNISTKCGSVYDNQTGKNETVNCVNITHYYDDNKNEMFCDFVLADKSCLYEKVGVVGQETKYDYLSLPELKEKVIINGKKIEQKQEGIPLPKNSVIQLKYAMKHPIAFNRNISHDVNKYNITVMSLDGSDKSSLDPTWWNSSWEKRRNVTITINDQKKNAYTNYFLNVSFNTRIEIGQGDIRPDCYDIRVVDNSGNSIDYKLIKCNSTDTRLWFNFTNTSATWTNYTIYYDNPTASQPTDYNISHWATGSDFDQMNNNTHPDGWGVPTAPNFVYDCDTETGGFCDSGTFSGNKSVWVSSKFPQQYGDLVTFAPIIQGKMEFKFMLTSDTGQKDTDFPICTDSSDATDVYFAFFAGVPNKLNEYAGSAWHTIGILTKDVEYFWQIEWDSNIDKWNYTIINSSSGYRNTNLAFTTAGGGMAKIRSWHFNGEAGGRGFIDDLIIRNTNGVFNEPSTTIGVEEIPAGDTTKPYFSTNSTNTTIANTPVNFSIVVHDETAVDFCRIETNNTGTFINSSWQDISGTSTNCYYQTTLNSTAGKLIQWKAYANDTSNNQNASETYSLVTISGIQVYLINASDLSQILDTGPEKKYALSRDTSDTTQPTIIFTRLTAILKSLSTLSQSSDISLKLFALKRFFTSSIQSLDSLQILRGLREDVSASFTVNITASLFKAISRHLSSLSRSTDITLKLSALWKIVSESLTPTIFISTYRVLSRVLSSISQLLDAISHLYRTIQVPSAPGVPFSPLQIPGSIVSEVKEVTREVMKPVVDYSLPIGCGLLVFGAIYHDRHTIKDFFKSIPSIKERLQKKPVNRIPY